MIRVLRFGPGSRFLLIAAAAVVVVAGLRAAAPILVPLVLAVYLAALSVPVLRLLPRLPGLRWIPHWVAVLLTAVIVVVVVGLAGTVLTISVRTLVGSLPEYRERLEAALQPLLSHAARLGLDAGAMRESLIGPAKAIAIVQSVVGSVLGLLSDALLILLLYIFALAGIRGHGARLREALGDQAPESLRHMGEQAQSYLRLKTVVSLSNGIGMGLLAGMLGIPFAPVWGFLGFTLNYIPNLGSIVATTLPALLALATRGWPTVLAFVGGCVLLDQVLSRVVEPRLVSRSLGLPPLVVIVSLLFWGWLWGPVGVVLAVPLTTTLKIILAETPDLRWLAVLGGDGSDDDDHPDDDAGARRPPPSTDAL
ncbi:MAG TPA: AI-2E family transporter [Vicinamibacteria bacterium]|nr:AI-2E family transporter [Vicinamibacteria bacterium]